MNHFVDTYGYWAVLVMVGAESLGLPLPGETALIAAGVYAGHSHHLSLWLVALAAATGAIVGDNIGYWIGGKGGYRLVRRWGHVVRFDEPKVKVARYVFDRHGTKVVFFGRFVSLLRTYAAFLAGTLQMRWRHFLAANALGGILWAVIFTVASYEAGSTLEKMSGTINIVVGASAVVAIGVGLLFMRKRMGNLYSAAEDAYPGPLE